jgi:hypothetical protein
MGKAARQRSLAPPAPSNSPTAEYRRHHRVVAPAIDGRQVHPYWSTRSNLSRLLDEGAIGRDEYAAGVTLRGWCETAMRGLRTSSWDVPIDNGGGRPGGADDVALAAARRLQAVATALGREWLVVLKLTVIDDVSWARIGDAIGVTPKTAKVRAVTALQMLAAWFSKEPAPRRRSSGAKRAAISARQ